MADLEKWWRRQKLLEDYVNGKGVYSTTHETDEEANDFTDVPLRARHVESVSTKQEENTKALSVKSMHLESSIMPTVSVETAHDNKIVQGKFSMPVSNVFLFHCFMNCTQSYVCNFNNYTIN